MSEPVTSAFRQAAPMGLRELLRTLKFKVVVVVASALIASLSSTYFVSSQSGGVATRLLLEQQTGEAELVADMLNGKAAQIQYILRLLASQLTPDLLRDSVALQDAVQARALTRQTFASLTVADANGQVLARFAEGQAQRAGE